MLWHFLQLCTAFFITLVWRYHNLGVRMLQHGKSDLDFYEMNEKKEKETGFGLHIFIMLYICEI